MQTLNQDAQRIVLLFEYGVIKADAVIAWADLLIVQLNPPLEPLLELSTTATDKTADILSHLHSLSAGADFWKSFRSAIPELHEYVSKNPDRAEAIANHLFRTGCWGRESPVPKDLWFINCFDDAFDLAREGTFKRENVLADFLKEFGAFEKS